VAGIGCGNLVVLYFCAVRDVETFGEIFLCFRMSDLGVSSCGWVVERWFENGNPAQWFRACFPNYYGGSIFIKKWSLHNDYMA
jgi:hypothetical protein